MNITQLRAFVAVVDAGSFSEAARIMGVSQPAVTMQVQGLESDVGATLLDRRYRRIEITEAGRLLLPHARAVLDNLTEAREEIDSLSGLVTGRLTVAASTTPGIYVVPGMLGGFVEQYPEVSVTVTVHDTAEVVSEVEEGRAQLGITGAVVKGARATFAEIGVDELVLVAPAGSSLATGDRVLADLVDEAWIMRESGSGTRQVTERVLAGHGVDPAELRVVTELGSNEAIVNAVEGGLGIAIVSRAAAQRAVELGRIVLGNVEGLPMVRPLYLVTPRGSLSRASETFIEALRAAF